MTGITLRIFKERSSGNYLHFSKHTENTKSQVNKRDLTAAFQCLKSAYMKDGDGLFSRAWCDRKRGNGFKQKEGRYRLDVRKKFFTIRVVKHSNRLPRQVVDAPCWKHSRTGWTGL